MSWSLFDKILQSYERSIPEYFQWYYLYHYHKEMVEEEWYETTRMVPKHTEKENVEKVYSHTHPFIRHFIRQSIKGGRVSANRKSFETNKMDEIFNVLNEFSETQSDNIIDSFKEYSKSKKIKLLLRTKKVQTGTKIRFRNGFCHKVLTSVDIQEIVKAGGRIIRILDGIVYEENFKTPPYRDYILILRDLRNKYKQEGNIVGSNCMKLLGNSLYGKSIQKDITTSRHLWSEATLKANFDSHVKSYPKVNETQYIVQINDEEKEFDCIPPKSTRLTPSHLGSFVLSHSKKILFT
ncbi:hypothetical protein LOTGIDRAFT_170820 [Lottia gigantea]|uniref:DNA-directed DNA polymerase n=1 Tax=Lottia gigantea TaxID=225164 RepID=V4BF33_LOTGI|nr:hypothetical protein LOTGIDRAFT_170820 [Lottia gigantea]ESP04427.1 hypothetical protein LOTGIDRAFT_170820 [Lottia gigantea]